MPASPVQAGNRAFGEERPENGDPAVSGAEGTLTGPAVASDFLKLQRKKLEKTNRPGVPLPLELQ